MIRYMIGDKEVYSEEQMRDIVEAGMARKKLSVNTLSQVSGVSGGTISNWLYHDKSIKYSTLERLLAYLID